MLRLKKILVVALALAACEKETTPTDAAVVRDAMVGDTSDAAGDSAMNDAGARTEVMVSADITADTTWTANNIYVLSGQIFVRNAVLTIQPGTEIRGMNDNVVLVITPTARIQAEGTAAQPIVFTSNAAMGNRAPSDWGGVVLLGNAPINVPGGTDTVEGLPPDNNSGTFGGNMATHNCGTMRYVRIEWAGFEFAMDKEFNGLTVAGCGSQTTLDYIQVHGSSDDGVEFFGGSANASHIVVTMAQDDSIDTDLGYSGTIQFLAVMQDAGGDEGWEADNLESNNAATPRSAPVVINATLIGGGGAGQRGIYWRRGTAGRFLNSVLTHFGDDCIEVKSDASIAAAVAGELRPEGNIIRDCNGGTGSFTFDPADHASAATVRASWEGANSLNADPMVTAMNPVPAAASMAGTLPRAAAPAGNTFIQTANYIGAFEPGGANWMMGWTTSEAAAE